MAIKFDASDAEERPSGRGRGRRRGSIGAWLRELISPEPAEERRRRIEAEAAAQLGLNIDHQPEHAG